MMTLSKEIHNKTVHIIKSAVSIIGIFSVGSLNLLVFHSAITFAFRGQWIKDQY